MNDVLSPNTQAILLLTAPLLTGRGNKIGNLLTPGEYSKLARQLRALEREPADLLTADADLLLEECDRTINKERLKSLLGRGFLLSLAIERWRSRAIWVMSRADSEYPQRLKARLKENSPALLYGCGSPEILDTGGLAVVGSRNVEDELVVYTRKIGGLTATAGRTLVSGGARGVDDAAMRGALDVGGRVVGVIPDSLEAKVLHRANRGPLLNERLVLISPYDPSSRFNVGHAMQRNKLLYALADAVLVVNADLNKGGTWAGATEQLDNLPLTPIYVRSTGAPSEGLNALAKKGALLWPNPNDADSLDTALNVDFLNPQNAQEQNEISFVSDQQKTTESAMTPNPPPVLQTVQGTASEDGNSASCPADDLFQVVRTSILRIAGNPRTAAEIASELALTPRQTAIWLKRLVDEGALEKHNKPVRYTTRQSSLFASPVSTTRPGPTQATT